MGNSVKHFTKVQADTASPSSTKPVTLSQKIMLIEHNLPFAHPCCYGPFLVLQVLHDVTQHDLLHDLFWHQGQADRPVVP